MTAGRPPADIRRAMNTAKMKTWATGDRLYYGDLLKHQQVHRSFDPEPLAKWMEAKPVRWYRFRNVADANRAYRRDAR